MDKNHQSFNFPKFIKLIKDRDSEAIYEEYKDSGLKKTQQIFFQICSMREF